MMNISTSRKSKDSPKTTVWAALLFALLTLGHPSTDDDREPLGASRRLAALATAVVFVLTFVAEPFRVLP